jgi:hypothetical protein
VDPKETFYSLEQNYGQEVDGLLVIDPKDEGEILFTGMMVLD